MTQTTKTKISGFLLIFGAFVSIYKDSIIGFPLILAGLIGFYLFVSQKPDYFLLAGISLWALHVLSFSVLVILSVYDPNPYVERFPQYFIVIILVSFILEILSSILIGVSILIKRSVSRVAGLAIIISTMLPRTTDNGDIILYICYGIIGILTVFKLRDKPALVTKSNDANLE